MGCMQTAGSARQQGRGLGENYSKGESGTTKGPDASGVDWRRLELLVSRCFFSWCLGVCRQWFSLGSRQERRSIPSSSTKPHRGNLESYNGGVGECCTGHDKADLSAGLLDGPDLGSTPESGGECYATCSGDKGGWAGSIFLSNQRAAGRSFGNLASPDVPFWPHIISLCVCQRPLRRLCMLIASQPRRDRDGGRLADQLRRLFEGHACSNLCR